MKRNLLLLALSFFILQVSAQVTIGSLDSPAEGVLLDLKEHAADGENVTTDKGLLLPRVKLVAKDSLQPLINNASDTDERELTGVIVYNVAEITGNETIRSMSEGLYMWNGNEWTMLGKTGNPNFFYMPSFDLPLGTIGSTQSVDLYNEYARQFKYDAGRNPNFHNGQGLTAVPGIYSRSDLYYVVLDYTPGVISNLQMDASGNLSYQVVSTTVPQEAYINIICVVKE